MAKPTLYLMMGYPGAGKTTTAKVICDLTGAERISSDEIRVQLFPQPTFSQAEHDQLYDYLDTKTLQLLQAGKSVVYDANLNRHQHRQDKYNICKETDAMPVLLWLKTPRDLAKDRATHHSRKHLWTKHETAGDMFDRIANIIEPPQPNEPYIQIDGTKVTPEYISRVLDLTF